MFKQNYFRTLANKANAALSTGPRTPEGKAKSCRNSLKHGLCALAVMPDEREPDVVEQRARWMAAFSPPTDIGVEVVDYSFRCKRRLERILDAEDAAIALRVRKSYQILEEARRNRFLDLRELFDTDPERAMCPLAKSVLGCEYLLTVIEKLREALEDDAWTEAEQTRLETIDASGLFGIDRTLEAARMILDADKARRSGVELPADLAADLVERAPNARRAITIRIDRAERIVRKQLDEAIDTESFENSVQSDIVKFDESETGAIRRRYLIDAERRFFELIQVAEFVSDGSSEIDFHGQSVVEYVKEVLARQSRPAPPAPEQARACAAAAPSPDETKTSAPAAPTQQQPKRTVLPVGPVPPPRPPILDALGQELDRLHAAARNEPISGRDDRVDLEHHDDSPTRRTAASAAARSA
ncbi:MAG: hypothetical protein SFX72_04440 [Isosphaeraceae bacterium]|nr:hypothetical protein [Isosphaeraceae bacterium]